MAMDSCYDCWVLPPPLGWDCDWELRTLAAGDAAVAAREDIHDWELRTLAAGEAAAATREGIHNDDFLAAMCVESPVLSDASSIGGYLEDAVTHWSDRCKRQRMTPSPPLLRRPAMVNEEDLQCLVQKQSLWDSVSGEGDLLHDSEMMILDTSSFVLSEEEGDASGREQEQEGPSMAAGQRSAAQGEAGSPPPPRPFPAATRQLQKVSTGEPPRRSSSSSNYGENELPSSSSLAGKENESYGVLCPFQFVKPMGLEGGGTTSLKDVNQRILKRPARPVRHPVGPFACSAAVSAGGVGLSGKAVVSITRIRTGGKGTITIIRTRG